MGDPRAQRDDRYADLASRCARRAESVPGGARLRTALAPEVRSRQLAHRRERRPARVDARQAAGRQLHRHELAFRPGAVATQRRAQHRRLAGDARHVERAVAEEVAEAVGDHASAIPLDAAEDVRAVADDEVGAGTDDGTRERHDVAARLAEEPLGPGPHVLLVGALGSRVHRHDDDVRLPLGLLHEVDGVLDVEQALRPGIRREAHERDLRPACRMTAISPGRPVKRSPHPLERGDRLRLARLPEVEGVVVGEVHDREARLLERGRVGRRRPEGEAVRASRAALGRAARCERALEVAERDVSLAAPCGCPSRRSRPRRRRRAPSRCRPCPRS